MASSLVGHTNPLGRYPAPVLPVLISDSNDYHARRGDRLISVTPSAVTIWPTDMRAQLPSDTPDRSYFAFSAAEVVAYGPGEELGVLLNAARKRGCAETSPFLFVSYAMAHDSIPLAQLALPFAIRALCTISPDYAQTWMVEILESAKRSAPTLSRWLSQGTIPDLLLGRLPSIEAAALPVTAPECQASTRAASNWNELEAALFARWRDGDTSALEDILKQNSAWMHQHVAKHLASELRAKIATEDVVQEAIVAFLHIGPRFVPENQSQLRALLMRIVANTMADTSKWYRAARRRISREVPLALSIDLRSEAVQPLDEAASREQHQRLRIAMEVLSERDRKLVYWRAWDSLSFSEVAHRLRIDEEAARAAGRRAIERLRDALSRLGEGDLDGALALTDSPEDSV